VALSNAVSGYIERIKQDDVYPSSMVSRVAQGDKVLEEKKR
jgi:hypothetical protein